MLKCLALLGTGLVQEGGLIVTKLEMTAMRLSVRSLHVRRSEAQRFEKLMYPRRERLPRCNAQHEGSKLVEIIEGGQSWANAFALDSQFDIAP